MTFSLPIKKGVLLFLVATGFIYILFKTNGKEVKIKEIAKYTGASLIMAVVCYAFWIGLLCVLLQILNEEIVPIVLTVISIIVLWIAGCIEERITGSKVDEYNADFDWNMLNTMIKNSCNCFIQFLKRVFKRKWR